MTPRACGDRKPTRRSPSTWLPPSSGRRPTLALHHNPQTLMLSTFFSPSRLKLHLGSLSSKGSTRILITFDSHFITSHHIVSTAVEKNVKTGDKAVRFQYFEANLSCEGGFHEHQDRSALFWSWRSKGGLRSVSISSQCLLRQHGGEDLVGSRLGFRGRAPAWRT